MGIEVSQSSFDLDVLVFLCAQLNYNITFETLVLLMLFFKEYGSYMFCHFSTRTTMAVALCTAALEMAATR